MSGNDHESFPNWSRKFASNFARNRPLPQCIRLVFFSKFCSMHFEKSRTHQFSAFAAYGIGMRGFVRPDVSK